MSLPLFQGVRLVAINSAFHCLAWLCSSVTEAKELAELCRISETCGHTLDTGAGWVCRE
jgi:hypothetical protein